MCTIMKLVEANRRIKKLEAQSAACQNLLTQRETRITELTPPVLPTGFPIYTIKWPSLVYFLSQQGLTHMMKLEFVPDTDVAYTDEAGWQKILPFLTYSWEYYVAEVSDCDDYAEWAKADSSKLFHLNGCRPVWGTIPEGRHAWNLVIVHPLSVRYFDANAGFPYAGVLFAHGENSYIGSSWE